MVIQGLKSIQIENEEKELPASVASCNARRIKYLLLQCWFWIKIIPKNLHSHYIDSLNKDAILGVHFLSHLRLYNDLLGFHIHEKKHLYASLDNSKIHLEFRYLHLPVRFFFTLYRISFLFSLRLAWYTLIEADTVQVDPSMSLLYNRLKLLEIGLSQNLSKSQLKPVFYWEISLLS